MIVVGTFHELFCIVHTMPKVQSFPFLNTGKKNYLYQSNPIIIPSDQPLFYKIEYKMPRSSRLLL